MKQTTLPPKFNINGTSVIVTSDDIFVNSSSTNRQGPNDDMLTILPAPFSVAEDENGDYHIDVKNRECRVFRFLEGASYIPNDPETSEYLLINKIYAIGYFLCRPKIEGHRWAVVAYDIDPAPKKNGGTGKGLFFSLFEHFPYSVVKLNGRNDRLFEDNHWTSGVTEETDLLLFDDFSIHLSPMQVLHITTSDLWVSNKGKPSFRINYDETPKIGVCFDDQRPIQFAGSERRRALLCPFTNYWANDDSKIVVELGKVLFGPRFNTTDWNNFYNTMLYCLHTYLKLPRKPTPPEQSVLFEQLTCNSPSQKLKPITP